MRKVFDILKARELRKMGLTYQEIGDRVGASLNTCFRHLRGSVTSRRKLDCTKALEMRRLGKTYKQIGVDLGLSQTHKIAFSRQAVWRALRDMPNIQNVDKLE